LTSACIHSIILAMEDEQVIPAPQENPKPGPVNKTLIAIIVILLLVIAGGAAYFLGLSKKAAVSTDNITPTPSVEVSITETPAGTLTPSPSKKPTATTTSTPTPTPTPTPDNRADLYISSYSFNHPPVMGEAFTLTVIISNQGNVASGDFYWEWWATISAPTYACRANVASVPAHGARTVFCNYTYGGWANYTTKAIADVDNGIDESNEGNNTYSQNVVPVH